MFYRSERLFLRPAFPEDCEAFYEAFCDARVISMLGSAPWPYTRQDAMRSVAGPVRPGLVKFLITLPEDGGRIVGGIGLHRAAEESEVGYWIARNHWGRGYATEALLAVCEIARALGLSRVTAGHFLDNPASGRVIRKAGFVETGEIRPTECKARGELLLSRRFARDLVEIESSVAVTSARAA